MQIDKMIGFYPEHTVKSTELSLAVILDEVGELATHVMANFVFQPTRYSWWLPTILTFVLLCNHLHLFYLYAIVRMKQ